MGEWIGCCQNLLLRHLLPYLLALHGVLVLPRTAALTSYLSHHFSTLSASTVPGKCLSDNHALKAAVRKIGWPSRHSMDTCCFGFRPFAIRPLSKCQLILIILARSHKGSSKVRLASLSGPEARGLRRFRHFLHCMYVNPDNLRYRVPAEHYGFFT
jgi:hypothetical protein